MNPNDTSNDNTGATGTAAAPSALYAEPVGMARPLRIVLVLPEQVPQWLATVVEFVAGAGWLAACVVPVAGAVLPTVTDAPLGLRAFLSMERAGGGRPSAVLAHVPLLVPDTVAIARGVSADMGVRQITERLRGLQPDLVISLGPETWAESLAELAKWGCWNIDANLVDPTLAGTGLLAPMLHGASATEIELQLLLQKSWRAPASVAASHGATEFTSFAQQRERAFLKLPMLLLRTLRRLATGDLDLPGRHAAQLRLAPPASPLGIAAAAQALAVVARHRVIWKMRRKRRGFLPWMLVLRQDDEPLDPAAPTVDAMALIQAPAGSFWADPCLVDAAPRQLVFVEEMTSAGKGTIACLDLQPETATRLGTALEEPCHLSYPQVFSWNSEWFLTVESSRQGRVSLYKALAFPLGWERVADLISGRVCVDPTLHFHDGRWFLFTAIAENGNSTWDELFLFVSEELTGPFRPHPANPILSDVRRARPAGRLFHHQGSLIRPSQDCATDYGSAVAFNEVLELTPETYRERPLSRLAPYWSDSLIGCHTYSSANGTEMLDVKGRASSGMRRLRVVEAGTSAAAAAGKPGPQSSARDTAGCPGAALISPSAAALVPIRPGVTHAGAGDGSTLQK